MSVVIMTRYEVDREQVQDLMGKHKEEMERLAEIARSKGAIHHQFLEDPDGSLVGLDEWEDEERFRRFFEDQEELRALMSELPMTAPPVSTTYRRVDAPDRF